MAPGRAGDCGANQQQQHRDAGDGKQGEAPGIAAPELQAGEINHRPLGGHRLGDRGQRCNHDGPRSPTCPP